MSPWVFRVFLWTPLVVIPLVSSPLTLDPALTIRYFLLSVYLLGGFTLLVTRKKLSEFKQFINRNLLFLLFFTAYWIISAISLFSNEGNFGDGIAQWMLIFDLGAAVVLFSWSFRIFPSFPDELAKGFVLLGLISCGIGSYQFYTLVLPAGLTHSSTYLLTGTYANKNIFAEVLSLMLPFLLFAVFRLGRIWKWIAGITLGLSVFLILVSLSRSAWVACFIAALVISILCLFLFRRISWVKFLPGKKTWMILAMTIIVALLVSGLFMKFGPQGILQKQIHSLTHPGYGSARDRVLLWGKTMEIIRQHPFWGTGMGTWKVEIMRYSNEGLKSADTLTFYQQPHNDFLWILSEQGLFALLLYLGLFVLIFRQLLINLKESEDRQRWKFSLVLLSQLMIYLVLSFFAFPKERIEHTIFISLAMAACLSGSGTGVITRVDRLRTVFILVPV
ncbi:MAG: O-antigen ligase family protein, partial [Bacteroidetes bacterium]|nr:O-antigen ligase family protein [Bacteroidota bacterium]